MVTFLLNLNKGSNQQELDNYFSLISPEFERQQVITKSALTQSRKQLKHSAFIHLNKQITALYYQSSSSIKTWRGHRLCAIDGSQIRLPREPEIIEDFAVNKGNGNQKDCPLGLASVYYDVLNNICLDSSLNHTNTSEKSCLIEHLKVAQKNDLSLLDRGYNAFWVYSLYREHNQAFCMRARVGADILAKEFVQSGKAEAIVTYYPNQKSIETCRERGIAETPIRLRLIRVNLKKEVEVLITNLEDEVHYPAKVFKRLYHLRWGVEEYFKRIKQWAEIANFSGKSALSVKQDFYAKTVSVNLTLMLCNVSQTQVNKHSKEREHRYQVNYAQALSKVKNTLVELLRMKSSLEATELIEKLIDYIVKTTEAVRKGRSFERPKHRIKNKKHYYAYSRAL